jgi:CubicO group peptidase (beta-lactamase class C family)
MFAAALLLATDLATTIDRIATESLGKRAGMSIAVVRGESVILAKGYGFANVEHKVPATADTVYHIDSITKHLTSALMLQLVEQKKLSLDDPVTMYVPQLAENWKNIRIRNLLNHTSGIESFTDVPSWGPQERLDITPDEVLATVRDLPPRFNPGSSWRYNNTGFYLAGLVIEKVTGLTYAEAMRTRMFEPLEMKSTRYGDFRPLIENRAAGYELDHGTLVNAEPMSWKAPFAGGAIVSTVLDLVRFERALESHRLFGDDMLRAMRSPTVIDGIPIDYGFGTRLGNVGGHRLVGHTGSGGGFLNALVRYPDDDLTIVILTNTDGASPPPSVIAARIAREVLGIAPQTIRDEPLPPDYENFLGTFESAGGNVLISIEDGKLGFHPGANGPFIPVHYLGDRKFAISPDQIVVMFPARGKVRWGQLYSGGMFLEASPRR